MLHAFLWFWRGASPPLAFATWWTLVTSSGPIAAVWLVLTLETAFLLGFWWSDYRDLEAS